MEIIKTLKDGKTNIYIVKGVLRDLLDEIEDPERTEDPQGQDATPEGTNVTVAIDRRYWESQNNGKRDIRAQSNRNHKSSS